MVGVWAVVPAFNEARVIGETLAGLRPFVERIIVVDDGSKDDTGAAATGAQVDVVRHAVNQGQGAALRTGIQQAIKGGAEIIVTFDADGQMEPNDIPRLVEVLRSERLDIVFGTRFSAIAVLEMPWLRKMVCRAAAVLFERLYGMHLSDVNNGFRVFTRAAAGALDIHTTGMAHALEIIHRARQARLRYREVPVFIRYTPYSITKGQRLSNVGPILWELLSVWGVRRLLRKSEPR